MFILIWALTGLAICVVILKMNGKNSKGACISLLFAPIVGFLLIPILIYRLINKPRR